MAATIKDIARQLNISTSTVSYALNGGPRNVPEDVRERVLALARELDYRPNRVARSLVTRRANSIGVVPPSVDNNVFQSPFVRSAWNGLVNAAGPLEQDLLLYTGHDRTRPNEPGQELLDGRIDGIVFIAPRPSAGAVRFLADRKFPFATIASEDGTPGLRFTADNGSGVHEAIHHLVELGHRRIAHIAGAMDSADGRSRCNHFLDLQEPLGLEREDELVQWGSFTIDHGARAGRRLLSLPEPPTAVFCANDEIAYGLCLTLRDMGLSVPEDISVIGFDDSDLSHVMMTPLTTVRQPVDAMAAAALQAVVAVINGADGLVGREFPTELVARESTAPPSPVKLRPMSRF